MKRWNWLRCTITVVLCAPVLFSCTGTTEEAPAPLEVPAGWVALDNEFAVGPAIVTENLAVFPIRRLTDASMCNFITLETGLVRKNVVVTEVGGEDGQSEQQVAVNPPAGQVAGQEGQRQAAGDGAVNTLNIRNNSEVPLLLLAGDIVKGGKQDRVIAQDMIIPARSKQFDISVFCVERGRWEGGAAFSVSPAIVDNTVRQTIQQGKGQSAVWDQVGSSNKLLVGDGESSTYLLGLQSSEVQERLLRMEKTLLAALEGQPDLVGLAVAVDGRLVCADIYHDSRLFGQLLARQVRGYALEAIKGQNARAIEERHALVTRKKPSPLPDPARVTALEVARRYHELLEESFENIDKSTWSENWVREARDVAEYILVDPVRNKTIHRVCNWQ
ncbi:MAG: hypothetical protein RDV41_10940 [Planctomycetota bacterium]|nr:hypothetical protein [Planctomycetota bacterium]